MTDKARYADLHLHTIFSDGTLEPRILISKAKEKGLSAVAIVDHDTIAGVQDAIAEATRCGLEVIPGIELSAEEDSREIHILGYFIDRENSALLKALEFLRKNRRERIYKITEKLRGLGVKIDAQEVFAVAATATVGRLHVARALLKKGLVVSLQEAFRRYIGDGGPAYALGFRLSPAQAIRLIKEAGGIPVLAHPYTVADDNLLLRILDCGVMGLEAYYPEHSQAMVNFYLELARQRNLLVSGGSDFHGEAKPEIQIGAFKIPYELVEKLKEAKGR